MKWCPWYSRTGERVRHKQSGKTGEIIWRHPHNGDVEVVVDGGGGTPVTWFGKNVRQATRGRAEDEDALQRQPVREVLGSRRED